MNAKRPVIISAILFDFDGTLTRPHNIDFPAIKQAVGCPADEPVLEFIRGMTDPQRQLEARKILDRFEMDAADRAQPNEDAERTVRELAAMGMPLAVLTRNSESAIERSFQNFRGIDRNDFGVVYTRDDGHRPKPHPQGVIAAAAALGVPAAELLCVGDYVFDVEVARNAGCSSAFLTNGEPIRETEAQPDFVIRNLAELIDIAALHRRLPTGKLPNDLLSRFLKDFQLETDDLLVSPQVGEDCAVVDAGGAELLALTSDPITYATDEIGYYAVTVNANDIVTTGAVPRWFLTTLMLPVGITAAEVHDIIRQLHEISLAHGITLCGGHTEITDAVTRPVISGQMIGVVEKKAVIRKSTLAPGHLILLTKRAAVEGTALIARELPDRLLAAGISTDLIERAARFLHQPGISVVPEARAAVAAGGVVAMHDVTEGGVATAVQELSVAGGRGIRVSIDQIPVFPETAEICRALGVDPLGLIGSGSLLIACAPDSAREVVRAVKDAGVEVHTIGEAVDAKPGVHAIDSQTGEDADWPSFHVDEIARLFH